VKIRRILVPLGIVLNVLGCWVNWEAVVKPLKDANPVAWGRSFPSPFYVFYAPLWFWHDLSYTLIIVGTLILGYYALKGRKYGGDSR